jgi:quaternary ammonium compound-resistance protein SugE
MALSMSLLAWSARTLPIGTAYAVWTGIGAAGTAVLGVYLFGEAASAIRVAGVGLIIVGVALLKRAG